MLSGRGKTLLHSLLHSDESNSEFADPELETLKLLVRSRFGTEVGFGITPTAISRALGANEEDVRSALSACEGDGDAWILFLQEGSGDPFWSGDVAQCDEPLPATYSCGNARVAAATLQPPVKKLKIGNGADGLDHAGTSMSKQSSRDPFEELKLLLHGRVASEGDKGVTSGKLGWELGCDRKAVTAALYACQDDGSVRNVASGGGPPHWVSAFEPPPSASSMSVPTKYGYKGTKALDSQQVQTAVAPQRIVVTAPVASIVDNPIAFLNEWGQKNKKALQFTDMGSGPGGFRCKVSVDGQEITVQCARNKKDAKAAAAAAAVRELNLVRL